MVFGHAPVILPAILRVAIPYSAALYVPLVLLHGSLVLRAAGDLANVSTLRVLGATGNVVAIAVFVVTAAALVFRKKRATMGSDPCG